MVELPSCDHFMRSQKLGKGSHNPQSSFSIVESVMIQFKTNILSFYISLLICIFCATINGMLDSLAIFRSKKTTL
jgi:hypothetical protein